MDPLRRLFVLRGDDLDRFLDGVALVDTEQLRLVGHLAGVLEDDLHQAALDRGGRLGVEAVLADIGGGDGQGGRLRGGGALLGGATSALLTQVSAAGRQAQWNGQGEPTAIPRKNLTGLVGTDTSFPSLLAFLP